MSTAASSFTAVLVLSFGGPERPEDVMPFLRNVTAGRGVPDARLAEVAEHYYHLGGASPINALNRDIVARLQQALTAAERDLPVYFGNRNWAPYGADAVATAVEDGHRRILVLTTSAWGGYSGCRQYDEDIAEILATLRSGGRAPESLLLRKLPHYGTHPLLIAANAAATQRALDSVPAPARVVFTAHSIPTAADARAGIDGHLYSRQVRAAATAVAERLGLADFDLVWQSRSGPPQVPWLGPDICDHLRELAAHGETAVVAVPIGFISDHMEVVWDLDNEARDVAAELGLHFARADTVGTDQRFIDMAVELIAAQLDGTGVVAVGASGLSDNGAPCVVGCCPHPARLAR